jgi:hypothetical protein
MQIAQPAQPGLDPAIGTTLVQTDGTLRNSLCQPLRQRWMLFKKKRECPCQPSSACSMFGRQLGGARISADAMVFEQPAIAKEAPIARRRQATIKQAIQLATVDAGEPFDFAQRLTGGV